jgi:glycosyltransferase involved in cell wall biosynthesis
VRIAFVADLRAIHTSRWVEFFVQRGHDVRVVSCGGGEHARDAGYDVVDLGAPPIGKLGYVYRIPSVRAAVRAFEPDVVHAHHATSYGMLAWASGVRPLVVTAHGSDVLVSPRNPAMRAVLRSTLRAADLVTVPSEQMREAVMQLAGSATPVIEMQYGVEVPRLSALAQRSRRDADAGAGTLRIVSARLLHPIYRIDLLLRGLAVLRARGVQWHCDLYGDGPERDELESLAARLGIRSYTEFHGLRPIEEVEQAMAEADVYASLAASDGASIALLEAMVLGSVPVVSDIPANRSWISDGVTGALTADTPEAVADAVERARALDRDAVSTANRATVAARADRATNLSLIEDRLRELTGRS